ncbi:hypothetical protein [Streptomyces sp. NPDC002132]|uniref:hypothetical protein n=1 Tax=unclassified Streptomyces TaxID=2593676 RepID=UPI00332C8113
MHRTSTTLVAALLLASAVGCSSEKSQDEIAADCQKALTSAATKTSRPDECKGLEQDDYEALLMAWALKQQGVVDESGDVDLGKLLDDATPQP